MLQTPRISSILEGYEPRDPARWTPHTTQREIASWWSNQAREHLDGAYLELEWAQFGEKTDGRPGCGCGTF